MLFKLLFVCIFPCKPDAMSENTDNLSQKFLTPGYRPDGNEGNARFR